MCVLIKDIGRRLPLELQCSLYQGQQGDVSPSVRGNCKTHLLRGQNLTAVEGNASVYQGHPVSHITGEGRAENIRASGPRFEQEGAAGGGGDGPGQLNLCAETINPLRGQI